MVSGLNGPVAKRNKRLDNLSLDIYRRRAAACSVRTVLRHLLVAQEGSRGYLAPQGRHDLLRGAGADAWKLVQQAGVAVLDRRGNGRNGKYERSSRLRGSNPLDLDQLLEKMLLALVQEPNQVRPGLTVCDVVVDLKLDLVSDTYAAARERVVDERGELDLVADTPGKHDGGGRLSIEPANGSG